MAQPSLLLVDATPGASARANSLRADGFLVRLAEDAASPGEAPAAVLIVEIAEELVLAPFKVLNVPVFVLTEDPFLDAESAGVTAVLRPAGDLAAHLAAFLPVGEPLTPEALSARIDAAGTAETRITCFAQGARGTLWLRNGILVDASTGPVTGESALTRIFTWASGGRFVVATDPHDQRGPLTLKAHDAVTEALRRSAIWHRLVDGLGGLDAIYRVDFVMLAQRLGEIPDAANAFLRLIDGSRTLRELLDDAGGDDLETLSVALRLRIDGVILPPSAAPAEVAPLETETRVRPPPMPSSGEGNEEQLPLVAAEAIEDALTWISSPGIPPPPMEGHIPVVRYPSERGARRLRLEQASLEARVQAAANHQRPILLTDEVRAPGALSAPAPPPFEQTLTEILASSDEWDALPPTKRRIGFVVPIVIAGILGSLFYLSGRMAPERSGSAPPPSPASSTVPPRTAPPVATKAASPKPPPAVPAPAPTAPASTAPKPTFEELLKEGIEANSHGHPAKAIPLLEQALEQKKTAAVYHELGRSYYATDKLVKAIESFQHATTLDAKDAATFREMGIALQDAGRIPEAKAAYTQFLKLDTAGSPHHAEIQSVLDHLEHAPG